MWQFPYVLYSNIGRAFAEIAQKKALHQSQLQLRLCHGYTLLRWLGFNTDCKTVCMNSSKMYAFFFFFFAATQCYALHSTRIVALTWMDIITSWDPHKVLDSRDIRSWFAQLTIAPVTQSECILILSLPLCLSPPQWDRERSARRHC